MRVKCIYKLYRNEGWKCIYKEMRVGSSVYTSYIEMRVGRVKCIYKLYRNEGWTGQVYIQVI